MKEIQFRAFNIDEDADQCLICNNKIKVRNGGGTTVIWSDDPTSNCLPSGSYCLTCIRRLAEAAKLPYEFT